ncbi:MAG: ComEC/Rec2 family competence protein [Ferruginibacter sp.]
MQTHPQLPVWKPAPFVRLLLPLIAGILLQWYIGFGLRFILITNICYGLAFLLFQFLSITLRFRLKYMQGILLNFFILSLALLLTYRANSSRCSNWYGNLMTDSSKLLLRINEPLTAKDKSYKTTAEVEAIVNTGTVKIATGKLLLYFSKTGNIQLQYGDKIIIDKPPQWIRNSGNPGSFNYERYSSFQQLFHTVYLKPEDYVVAGESSPNWFYGFLYHSQDYILNALRKNIPGSANEEGIAEALLIGYKEDLDKDLVQAYSNTGVVHIIAISGLHLGLIYAVLVWIFTKMGVMRRSKTVSVILILTVLWMFSLLTGASASVLRSAVMFSFLLTGKTFFRQASGYNALAASAFLLLCWNPYYCWDVGFQLSYLAVFGIMWLQQFIYKIWFIKSKWLRQVWAMISVTLAAQLITFPVCIYYFHQFPNLFLFTNLLAVPLSTIILYAELLLIVFASITPAATLLGKAVYWLIYAMNYIVQKANDLPFSVIDRIYANLYSTWALYVLVFSLSAWLLYKKKKLLYFSFLPLLMYAAMMFHAVAERDKQQKIIIYNINRYRAVDFVYKDEYFFEGDSILLQDALPRNFYLKPARISMQLQESKKRFRHLVKKGAVYHFAGKTLFMADKEFIPDSATGKLKVDILLISKNPKYTMANITGRIEPSVIVFDASNALWKIAEWKRECDGLHLHYHSVPEQGAFVLDL